MSLHTEIVIAANEPALVGGADQQEPRSGRFVVASAQSPSVGVQGGEFSAGELEVAPVWADPVAAAAGLQLTDSSPLGQKARSPSDFSNPAKKLIIFL